MSAAACCPHCLHGLPWQKAGAAISSTLPSLLLVAEAAGQLQQSSSALLSTCTPAQKTAMGSSRCPASSGGLYPSIGSSEKTLHHTG